MSGFRPVSMRAATTNLGMIPLMDDVFFRPMAVTTMFRLEFDTLLTPVLFPVLFALFYEGKYKPGASS